jgi:hypothetical protein
MGALRRMANGRNILLLLVLFLLMNLVVIPVVYPKFPTLDTLPSYTPSEAYQHLSSYGDQGRRLYSIIELTLDLIYPFISAMLFSLLILYTFQRAFPAHAWTHKLALIPLAVMLADYLENASIVTMLLSYPRQLPLLAAISNVFTVTKSALSWFELILIVGLIGWLMRVLRRRVSLRIAS